MPQPIAQPCGTYAAARRHERRREPLCQPCIDARRKWYRDRARLAYSLPTFRARENARTAARLARRRAADPDWRTRANLVRNERRRAQRAADRVAARRTVDPVVVDRLTDGLQVKANKPERLEAVARLHAQRCSYFQIAQLVGVTERQVHRDLAELGLTHQEAGAA
jgi:hypothetical protein